MTSRLRKRVKYKTATAAAIFAAALSACCTSCNTITDDALPALPVNINLSPVSVWNTYGVTAFGSYRYFVMQNSEPSGFPYIGQSATGFGGVLLVCGFNPYTTDAGVPMAYDLACPVERRAEVRVRMKATDTFPMAVCPECGRSYVAGGTTTTQIKYSDESNPYTQNKKSQDALSLIGNHLDLAV